ncbi:MAG: phytoene/squalene synthase family protein [Chthonomonas sp.]|nr:phytoene/squalene synthase family protein [Chthonomonas sp.]
MTRFASESDYAECEALHRLHGTSYYFATRSFPARIRRRTHAIYGFVRVADEIVDNPGSKPAFAIASELAEWRAEWLRAQAGQRPDHPVMRAFIDTVNEAAISPAEVNLFLDAMEQDLSVTRYATFADLEGYMRGSASAVGLMMCAAMDVELTPSRVAGACALGNAMQLTNFLRDVAEDWERGRVYLPLEDLERFGVSPNTLGVGAMSPEFAALMRFEIARTRLLYEEADEQIMGLPRAARRPVLLARRLYSGILGEIERRDYNVFTGRARLTQWQRVRTLAGVLLGR